MKSSLLGSLAVAFTVACAPTDAGADGSAVKAGASAPASAPRQVKAARVEEVAWERTLRVTGELAEFESATLSTKVPGRVGAIAVDFGARVAKGAAIAEIDPRDYELRVAQAEAALAAARALLGLPADAETDVVDPAKTALVGKAQAELDDARRENRRLIELQQNGVSAQADLDKSRARLAQAESALQDARESVQNRSALVVQRRVELSIAKQQLADARILAPFDGVVASRQVGTGDFLAAGAAVARLVDDDPLRLRLELREADGSAVRLDQRVRVTLDGESAPLDARLVRLSPTIDSRTRTLTVEAELPNPNGHLRAGAFARAEIVVEPDARVLAVAPETLVSFAGLDKVFAVVDGRAQEKRVVVGRRDATRVEILSGLAAGDVVVLAPGGMQNGAAVEIVK
ncbi:MAG: efflux RND transporter periplasmic adaptor subunit [Planctomycetes bacterium]|nr:efflux RND transporter periplasmic adaptor subunit [Planctomycetota bacterium]